MQVGTNGALALETVSDGCHSRIEMKILLMESHLFSGRWEIKKQRLLTLQARESQM